MPSPEPILITGASGRIGSSIAKQLLSRNVPLRLLARDINKLGSFETADKIAGSYEDLDSLDRAFAGVRAAFIVSGYSAPGERAKLHRNAFEAAKRAGVPYVVYLSFLGASPTSRFPMSRDHFKSEQYLAETGIKHTVLRDSFYSELALQMFDKDGLLKGPAGDGRVSWVGREEVAEAVANLLSQKHEFYGAYPMTGPSALSLEETAKTLQALTGRTLRYEEETLPEAYQSRSHFGAPEWEVQTWVGSYEAIAAGEVAEVDPALSSILGRPASDLATYLSSRQNLWR